MTRLLALSLLTALVLSTPVATAFHLKEGQVCSGTCPVAGRPNCKCDYSSCHYYCVEGPGRVLPESVPSSPGPELQRAVVTAGGNIAYLTQLREGAALTSEKAFQAATLEQDLSKYYEQILKADPKNFWGNWDYATLKRMEKDYTAADRLYAEAVSTLDPATRKQMVEDLQIPAIEKLRLNERPAPETSPFLSKIRDSLGELVSGRGSPAADLDGEKLTWAGKLAQKVGLYDQYEAYNQCVAGRRTIGGCVVDALAWK